MLHVSPIIFTERTKSEIVQFFSRKHIHTVEMIFFSSLYNYDYFLIKGATFVKFLHTFYSIALLIRLTEYYFIYLWPPYLYPLD